MSTTIKLTNGFEVSEIKVWNPYQQLFINRYVYALNGKSLGYTHTLHTSSKKLKQWVDDIKNGFIVLKNYDNLTIKKYN